MPELSHPATAATNDVNGALPNPILRLMELALPLFAVQRLANGQWLVRTQMGDPLWPPVDVVAVIDEQASAAPRQARRKQDLAATASPAGMD
jgi:hypothetical protein